MLGVTPAEAGGLASQPSPRQELAVNSITAPSQTLGAPSWREEENARNDSEDALERALEGR